MGAVWESLRLMQKLFPLRQCEDSYYRARTRPCLQHQLGRCSAPCVDKISNEEYHEQVKLAKLFLKGKNSDVIQELVIKMETSSDELAFEKAAKYRDQISTLRKVQQQQFVSGLAAELDVVGLHRIRSLTCIHILFIRDQKILGSKSYFPTVPAETEDKEIIEAFIGQHYLGDEVKAARTPKEIVIPNDIESIKELKKLLSEQSEHDVKISLNVRSERAQYLKLAKTNAENALLTKNSEKESIQARYSALNEVFELDWRY